MPDYKVRELAKELNTSERNVRSMIASGSLPSYKIGRRGTRVPEDAVRQLRKGR